MFAGIWPPAPKRDSMPGRAPPIPKSTTTTIPERSPRPAHDVHWLQVKNRSPSLSDVNKDTSERLEYSHVDGGGGRPHGTPSPVPSAQRQNERDRLRQQVGGSLAVQRKPESTHQCPPPLQSLEERDQLRQQVEAPLTTQYRAEGEWWGRMETDVWFSVLPEGEKEQEGEPDTITVGVVDALKEENEKLKIILRRHAQQLDDAREEMERERSKMQAEVAKPKEELDAAGKAHKEEVERLKTGLQEHAQRVQQLIVEHEHGWKDGESVRGNLSAEIERLKLAHAKETERLKTELEEANDDRTQAHSELREVRKSLHAHPKLYESPHEIDALYCELFDTKDSKGDINAEIERLEAFHAKEIEQLNAAREEMEEQCSRMHAEAEKLEGELNAAREAHKGEADTLRVNLRGHAQRVERLTAERERIQKDRESIKENLSAEIDRLKLAHTRETEQLKAALEEANRDCTRAHSELREVRKSLDAYIPKLDESRREIEALRCELSNTRDSNRTTAELNQRLDIQSKELQSAREESSALKKEFSHLLTRPEDQILGAKGAQSFLRRAGALSGTEITSALQGLNAEVMQNTAFMAESTVESLFFRETMKRALKTKEQLAACKRASDIIGDAIVNFLGIKKHKDDPILIQIAFQACLVHHLRWIAGACIISGDENQNRFIDAIYRGVHEKEGQTIAARWRALTRAHVPSTTFDDSQMTLEIVNRIVSDLSDILLTAGCRVPRSGVSSTLSSKFTDKLVSLVSLAMHVNKVVGEDVASGDFEVMAVPPATAFDTTTMEDSYDDDDGVSVREGANNIPKVLCTTELGLWKKTRVPGMTGEKQWETKVLLKPKVALETVTDIMDDH